MSDKTKAEELYEALKNCVQETMGWSVSDRRIFSLDFYEKKKLRHVEVGKLAPMTGEIVVAIFESSRFLVCTPNRGVSTDRPIMVGKHEPFWVHDFEA